MCHYLLKIFRIHESQNLKHTVTLQAQYLMHTVGTLSFLTEFYVFVFWGFF